MSQTTILSDEDLQEIYTWVDQVPLSRAKRNITRDFSDGVLLSEVLYHYFPKMVELKNYSAANSVRQKLYNWQTLNNKVRRGQRQGGMGAGPAALQQSSCPNRARAPGPLLQVRWACTHLTHLPPPPLPAPHLFTPPPPCRSFASFASPLSAARLTRWWPASQGLWRCCSCACSASSQR